MSEPAFLSEQAVVDLHHDLIDEYGGAHGCDFIKLGSVVAYPQQKFAYSNATPGIPELGAAFGFAACAFHAFVDGNKRVALAGTILFLLQNGFDLTSTDDENIETFFALAAGEIGEEDFVNWVVSNSVMDLGISRE